MKKARTGQLVISKAVVEAVGRPRPGAGQDISVLCRWPGQREDRAKNWQPIYCQKREIIDLRL